MRRVASLVALSLVALSTSGCASFWRGAASAGPVAPSGLPWGEELTRRALVVGAFDQAWTRTQRRGDGAPSDELLAALFRGQVAYHAGHFDESVRAFADAERLMERRETKSATRGVGSLLFNDRTLRYVPARTERLFARYYALLARLESGDLPAATVEARRLSALLEASASDLDPTERATHAVLREVAGAVFEAAGEWNDAGVAYRNAALLRGTPRAAVDSLVATAPSGDSATLVLVVEEGFAGHYVSRTVALPLDDAGTSAFGRRRRGPIGAPMPWPGPTPGVVPAGGAVPAIAGGARRGRGPSTWPRDRDSTVAPRPPTERADSSTASRQAAGDSALSARWLRSLHALPGGGVFEDAAWDAGDAAVPMRDAGAALSSDSLLPASVAADWTPRGGTRTRYLGDRWSSGRWLEVAWPMLVRARVPSAPLALELLTAREGDSLPPAALPVPSLDATGHSALVGDALGADARRRLPAQLARLAVRVATRAVVAEAVREEHGEAAGLVAQLVGSALERPDTRGWHLLPGRVRVVRVTVPVGVVTPDLRHGAGPNARRLEVPAFRAAPGSVTVRAIRLWRDPLAGAREIVRSDPEAVLTPAATGAGSGPTVGHRRNQ